MSYQIAGYAVKNEYLALATLIGTGALAGSMIGGGEKKAATPAKENVITTSDNTSKDEQDFIKQFVAEAEKEEKKH